MKKIKSIYNIFWNARCVNCSKEEFEQQMKVSRKNIDFIIIKINAQTEKIVTSLKPEHIPLNVQLVIALYQLCHGCTYSVVSDIFGVFIPFSRQTLNKK